MLLTSPGGRETEAELLLSPDVGCSTASIFLGGGGPAHDHRGAHRRSLSAPVLGGADAPAHRGDADDARARHGVARLYSDAPAHVCAHGPPPECPAQPVLRRSGPDEQRERPLGGGPPASHGRGAAPPPGGVLETHRRRAGGRAPQHFGALQNRDASGGGRAGLDDGGDAAADGGGGYQTVTFGGEVGSAGGRRHSLHPAERDRARLLHRWDGRNFLAALREDSTGDASAVFAYVFEPPVPVRLDWNMALEVAGGDVAFDADELLRIVREFLDDEFRRRYGSGETYRYGYLAFDIVEMETAAGGEDGARMDLRSAGEAVFDGHLSPGAVYVDRVLSNMFREGGGKGRFNAKLQWGSDPLLRSVRRSWRVDDAAAMAEGEEGAGWNPPPTSIQIKKLSNQIL